MPSDKPTTSTPPGHNAARREAFERTIQGRSLERYATGSYVDPFVSGAWFGWQAKELSGGSEQQPAAISKADHAQGEIGYCEFLQPVPYGTSLFAAPQSNRPEGLDEAIARLTRYLDERDTLRGIDVDGIHELHAGTDRECSVHASDIRTLIAALSAPC